MSLLDPGPRPRGRQRNDWQSVLVTARANPGQWVRADVPVNASVASHIKKGRYRLDPAEVEVTTRMHEQDPTRSWIYLRTRVAS